MENVKPLTVAELIDLLQEYPADCKVYLWDDAHHETPLTKLDLTYDYKANELLL